MKQYYVIICIDPRFGVIQHWELFETEAQAHLTFLQMNAVNPVREYKVIPISVAPTPMPESFTIGCG